MDDQQRRAGQPDGEGAAQGPGQPYGAPPPPPAHAPGGPQAPGPYSAAPGAGRRRNVLLGSVAGVAAAALIGAGIWYAAGDGNDDKAPVGAAASQHSSAVGSPASAATPRPSAIGGAKPVTAAPSASGTAAGQSGAPSGPAKCTPAGSPPSKMTFPSAPPVTIDTAASYEMTLATSCGNVVIQLAAAKAPTTVNSFAFLAGKDYFDHTPCHRLTTQGIFVLQCGDPTGTGTGGPGYKFADENLAGAKYPAGTIAMANAGPGTNGSQFFIVYKDTTLAPNYTPFGTVTAGLDIIRAVAAEGVWDGSADGKPKALVVLEDVTVAKKS